MVRAAASSAVLWADWSWAAVPSVRDSSFEVAPAHWPAVPGQAIERLAGTFGGAREAGKIRLEAEAQGPCTVGHIIRPCSARREARVRALRPPGGSSPRHPGRCPERSGCSRSRHRGIRSRSSARTPPRSSSEPPSANSPPAPPELAPSKGRSAPPRPLGATSKPSAPIRARMKRSVSTTLARAASVAASSVLRPLAAMAAASRAIWSRARRPKTALLTSSTIGRSPHRSSIVAIVPSVVSKRDRFARRWRPRTRRAWR